MIKKIKSSLWLKIFLLLTTLLFAVSLLLYGIVMAVMPASYKSFVTSNYMEKINALAEELNGDTPDDAAIKIYEFGLSHNATMKLQGTDSIISFGEEDQADKSSKDTIAVQIELTDGSYLLTISSPLETINQITQTFWRLLPIIEIVVLAISLIASYFVTRFLTKPVIEISDISKRLTALDMTWRCDTSRTDEVGTLAVNLNTMAAQLDNTLKELTEANNKLQKDIEQERYQEKLRIDFFRAVSHELKTPITVLKGELEGMICRVGEYKNRDFHLRQSMRTVNEMETLVKEILSASRMAGTDLTGEGDDKQFYTITTEAGNVFYLIIDEKRDDNNVYFLNSVTEADLMALAEKGDGNMSTIPEVETCTCTEKCEAGEVNISCPVCKNDLKSCTGKEKPDKDKDEEPAEPEKPKKDTGSAGTIIFLIVALLAAGGVGYYVKIVRPKQQAEDDEDSLDDGYGEGFDPDEAYGEPEYFSEDDFDDRINHEHEDSE